MLVGIPPQRIKARVVTDIDAYTPGMCALATLSGNGESHRSGFHSSASGPQMRVDRFAFRMEMMTLVSFFSGMDVISLFPSADLTGQASGKTISCLVLIEHVDEHV